MRKRSLILAVSAGLVLGGGLLALVMSSTETSPFTARSFYQRIREGMTREQVKELMRSSGAMCTNIESSDIMHLGGRFMIAVTFEPVTPLPPGTIRPPGQAPDNWVVKQKVFVDIKQVGLLEGIATILRLRPERNRVDRAQLR
ncbi:MAG: hypothetical protein ACHRXM_06040 [Isosphaerales bacterium]